MGRTAKRPHGQRDIGGDAGNGKYNRRVGCVTVAGAGRVNGGDGDGSPGARGAPGGGKGPYPLICNFSWGWASVLPGLALRAQERSRKRKTPVAGSVIASAPPCETEPGSATIPTPGRPW